MKRSREYELSDEDVQEQARYKLPEEDFVPVKMPRSRSGPLMRDSSYYSPKARKQYKRKIKRKTKKRYSRRGYGGNRYGNISVIQGRGDYSFSNNRSTGANWGGWMGSKAGEFLGDMAQQTLYGVISGLGDYSVKKNVFADGRLPEIMNNNPSGGIVISFQEYLGDVVTSGTANTFNIQNYIINAANEKTFPWLAEIASNFEQYELQGMLFQFRSTSADALNSTNTALGSVMMATQYDIMDIPFTSKSEMLNYEFSCSGKPSDNLIHMIECAPNQTTIDEKFTLTSDSPPTGADPRLYHHGRFSIATTGFQGTNVNIGELHVTYQIRLLKPKLSGNTTPYFYKFDTAVNVWNNAQPLGAVPGNGIIVNSLGIQMSVNGLGFPLVQTPKFYRIFITWDAGNSGVNITFPSPTVTNGVTLIGGTEESTGPVNSPSAYYSETIRVLSDGKNTPFWRIPDPTLPNCSVVPGILSIRVYEVPPV